MRRGLLAAVACAVLAGLAALTTTAHGAYHASAYCTRHPARCQTTPSPTPTTVSPSPTPITASPSPTASPTPVPPPTTATADPSLLWDDEFNGDLSQWNVRNNDTANGMLERRMAANCTVAGGLFDEQVRAEQLDATHPYTSCYVDTIGKDDHVAAGTRVDIRAKFPTDPDTGKGMWSALWFRGDTGPGEVDLVEAYSNKPDLANAWECVVITVHQNTDGTGSKKSLVYRFPAGQFPYQVFHTYSVEFATDRLIFSIDGTVVATWTTATYPWMAAELADTWNMRVNQQVSAASQWFYAPDVGTVFPRDMLVDFVRVYAH